MADALIDNPILEGPYDPPTRHWRFDDTGITDEFVEGRRSSGHFVPAPQPRQQSAQLALETSWTLDRLKPNDLVNQLRTWLEAVATSGAPSPDEHDAGTNRSAIRDNH